MKKFNLMVLLAVSMILVNSSLILGAANSVWNETLSVGFSGGTRSVTLVNG